MSLLAACVVIGLGLPGATCDRGGQALVPIPPPRGGVAVEPSNVDIGQTMAAEAGWTGSEWWCLYKLWSRESGWQTSDPNPTSGADGIAQALPPSKYGPGWEGDARQQIAWGIRYIKSRYSGSACVAWAHSNAYNFY